MSALGEEMDILKVNLAATVKESQTFFAHGLRHTLMWDQNNN